MAYRTTNAAYAYDMQPRPYAMDGSAARAFAPAAPEVERPSVVERPSFDVVTGAGREADQDVSPAFMRVLKTFCLIAVLVCAVGAARIALAGVTTASLNANAELSSTLESAREESSDLEVMRSVYGSSSRIRELAASTLGMVEGTDGTTVDLSDAASEASSASEGADASAAADVSVN